MFNYGSASTDDLKYLRDLASDSDRDFTMADRQYEIIAKAISDYEKELDENSEVALNLTHFNQNFILKVTDIGYSNPSLIHYYGYVDKQYSELIQHVSQINFLLTSRPKDNPDKQARRIGFNLTNKINNSDGD